MMVFNLLQILEGRDRLQLNQHRKEKKELGLFWVLELIRWNIFIFQVAILNALFIKPIDI